MEGAVCHPQIEGCYLDLVVKVERAVVWKQQRSSCHLGGKEATPDVSFIISRLHELSTPQILLLEAGGLLSKRLFQQVL